MSLNVYFNHVMFIYSIESETETGDFERLSRQSTSDKQRVDISTTCVPDSTAVATVTEVRTLPAIPEWPETCQKCPGHPPGGSECPGGREFEESEFYIEESLPSSLEWGRDVQVSLIVR